MSQKPGSPAVEGGSRESGEELTLEARLQRLEEIVTALEAGDVELERGLRLFEEGIFHIRTSERLISRAELRVEELTGEKEGTRTEPLGMDAQQ
ncbi:MAG: exodeoxyribonuclease VII small subunit [Gammaproteobacteria bacterium]|nr:exodeoxyribonuclease VII small subunit [Gammaproteobacteria bacterium]MDE0248751.1 exodeoxyribonuclease VII small subunit [Gammaproteobacteria bacterium]